MVLFGGDTLLDRSACSTTSSNTSTRSLNSGQDVDAFFNSRKVTGYTYAKTRSYNRNYPDHYENPKLLSLANFTEIVDIMVSYAAECMRSVRKSVARTNPKRDYDMPSPTELFKKESGGISWHFAVLCLLLFIGTLYALHLYDQSSSTSAIELVQTQDASNTILQSPNSDISNLHCPNSDISNLQDLNSDLCHPSKHHFVCECKCKCNKLLEPFEMKIQSQLTISGNNNNPAPLATITEHNKSADQTSSASPLCNNSDNKLRYGDDGPSLNTTSSYNGGYKYRNNSKNKSDATWSEMIRITPGFWLLDLQ